MSSEIEIFQRIRLQPGVSQSSSLSPGDGIHTSDSLSDHPVRKAGAPPVMVGETRHLDKTLGSVCLLPSI